MQMIDRDYEIKFSRCETKGRRRQKVKNVVKNIELDKLIQEDDLSDDYFDLQSFQKISKRLE